MTFPRLREFSLPFRLTITLFVALLVSGYLLSVGNIVTRHEMADGSPGLTLHDIVAHYHGLTKVVAPDSPVEIHSEMLREVGPDGGMREYLDDGGPSAVRALLTWLAAGGTKKGFLVSGVPEPGDPSPANVIRDLCVECHHAAGGDMEDVPYAPRAGGDPDYALVAVVARAPVAPASAGPRTIRIAPVSAKKLLHVTHSHILSIPVFVLAMTGLFLLTGAGRRMKLILGPMPMAAITLDILAWWLARPIGAFAYLVPLAGAVFGASFCLQAAWVICSTWRRTATSGTT